MSADNWATCPRCLQRAQKAYDQQLKKIAEMYGKVPVEEFDAARDALEQPDAQVLRTFREDYEFSGAEGGTVQVEYSGNCLECHLSLHIRTEHEIPGVDD